MGRVKSGLDRAFSICGGAGAVLLFLTGGGGQAHADSILFVGNSFTFGALSPVWKCRMTRSMRTSIFTPKREALASRDA